MFLCFCVRVRCQLLVLKYVQNKDVFMRYHKAHLTRRLILDISADSETEENMVEWLRVRPARERVRVRVRARQSGGSDHMTAAALQLLVANESQPISGS